MDLGNFEHWGIVVQPGETMKCDPGEIYCHISQIALQAGKGNEDVRVFVKVAGQEILLGTLSVDRYPHHTTDLVFDKEFELLNTSKTSNIYVIGYKFSGLEKRSDTSTEGDDDDSDDDVPLAIPLYSNADDDKGKETKGGESKAARPAAAAAQSSKPMAALEETKNTGNLKADVGGNDEDDSEEGESDDDDYDDEKAKAKNKPAETPFKTPPVKKAKVETPSVDHKTGSDTAKRSVHIHVATPYPSKQVRKSTFNRR